MDTQIRYEQLRYAVWTVSYSNQIPSRYAQNRIWADSLNVAIVVKIYCEQGFKLTSVQANAILLLPRWKHYWFCIAGI